MNSTSIDRLIELCKSYLDASDNSTPVSSFLTWVIMTASGCKNPTEEHINARFLAARIWGNDELLNEIRTQLDVVRTSPVKEIHQAKKRLPPSSARVGEYVVSINNNIKSTYRLVLDNDYYVYHPVGISKSDITRLANVLREEESSISDACDVIIILRRLLSINDMIYTVILDDQLVKIDVIIDKNIYLLKGSNGVLIGMDNNRQYCIGRLNHNYRDIITHSIDRVRQLTSNNRSYYIERLKEDIKNRSVLKRLSELVKANVINPDFFDEVEDRIEYKVYVVGENDNSVTVGYSRSLFNIGFLNSLIIEPCIDYNTTLLVDKEIKKTDRSVNDLIESVSKLLNQ